MSATPRAAHHGPSGAARAAYFLRHLGEMILVMIVGMAAGGVILVGIFSTVLASQVRGLTPEDVAGRYPVLICVVVAAAMVAPMVAWMRHRGMAWRPVAEMATAMVAPLAPIFALLGIGIVAGASACGLYCATMLPAMLVPMLFRFDLYSTEHTWHMAPDA